jgi:hypothetical protein
VTPARRSTTAGERVCLRARFVDAARCETSGTEVTWTLRKVSGEAVATLDRNCLVVAGGASTGEFELTAAAGAFSARAVVTVVTADRYRDLVAARLEDPDAGAVEPVATGTGVGAVSVASPPPAARAPSLLWALLGLAGVLGVAGVALLVRRRRASLVPPPPPTLPPPTLPPPTLPPPTSQPSPPSPAPPAPAAPQNQRQRRDARAVFAEQLPPPPPPPPPPPGPSKACPKCGTLLDAKLAFCPHDGTALGGAPVAAPPPSTAAGPTEGDGVCPKCGRHYPPPTVFCGEDGASLVPRRS